MGLNDEPVPDPHVQAVVRVPGEHHVHRFAHLRRLGRDLPRRPRGTALVPAGVRQNDDRLYAPVLQQPGVPVHGLRDVREPEDSTASGITISGVLKVATPMKPTFTPSLSTTSYGGSTISPELS